MHGEPHPPWSKRLLPQPLQHSQPVIDQHFDDKALGFPGEPLEHPLLEGHVVVADVHQCRLVILPNERGDPRQAARGGTLSLHWEDMGNSMTSTGDQGWNPRPQP